MEDKSLGNSVPDNQPIATPAGITGLHILLVDDMEDIVDGLKTLLEFEGATVYTATNAQAALDMIDGLDLDLMLSDVGMPDMDGYTFIKEVRKKPRFAKLPAIALTGFGRMQDAERAREVGFSAHISKPVILDVLIQTAMQLCRKP
jgi:two-component system CheB/CheR fusion protein